MLGMSDFGSTPEGYMTPDQIKQMQTYAGNLTAGGQRDSTITSPWQGVRMLADTLAGRSMRNQFGQAQKQGMGSAADTISSQPAPGSFNQPVPYMGSPMGASASSMNPMMSALMTQPPTYGMG